jgi:hypothetical protein
MSGGLERPRRARVLAAFRAAAERPRAPFVRIAFRAAVDRARAPRRFAAERACRASDRGVAAARPSRRRAPWIARERVEDRFFREPARRSAYRALRRVRADAVPFAGALSATPARRAFESPIAIACFAERAPCFPSRT